MRFRVCKRAADTRFFRTGKKRADFRVFKSDIIFRHFFDYAHSDEISGKVIVCAIHNNLPVNKEANRNKERNKNQLNNTANEPEFAFVIAAGKRIDHPNNIKNNYRDKTAD